MDYKNLWNGAMNYSEYTEMISDLIGQGKSTGPKQSDELLHFSKLNLQRMSRLTKTFDPSMVELAPIIDSGLNKVLVITEGWCGDAAQSVPIIVQIMERAGIQIKLVLRDDHLDLIDAHLTNGGRSIPIMLFLNNNFELIAKWGPRPAPLQKMVLDFKRNEDSKMSYGDISTEVQLWYHQDKQKTMIAEWSKIANRL